MKISISHVLITTVSVLLMLGLVMIYSSSALMATSNYHDAAFFFKRQLVFVCLGVGAICLGAQLKTDIYYRLGYLIYFAALALLVLVLIPGIGKSAGGAARWIAIGPFRLQGGEVFKVALVFYLAMSLAKKGERMVLFHVGIIPHLVVPGIAMILLLLEPDFGTTFLAACVTLTMLFVGGARIGYLFGAFLVVIPFLIHLITSSPYRLGRVIAFLDPWAHRHDVGYQIVESLISLGSGGFFGLGLGQGPSKLYFLPASHTDFILSMIGEELGFVGISFVLFSFALIAFCGMKIAQKQTDPFCAYLAIGFTTLLVLQTIINAFVVMGLVPTKGVTLPFVSYGGSSLLISCFMVGILYRLSRQEPSS